MFVDNTQSCVSQQSPMSGCSPVTSSLPTTIVTSSTEDDHTTPDTTTTSAIPTKPTTVLPTPEDTCSPSGPSLVAKCQSMYKICYNGNTTHQVYYIFKKIFKTFKNNNLSINIFISVLVVFGQSSLRRKCWLRGAR